MTKEPQLPSQGNATENKLVQVGNYKFTGKVLGKGSFALVKEAIHTKLKVHVSVKIIDLKKCNAYMLKNYLREANILKRVNHPFIMKVFETMQHNNSYYMVTELVQGGDLCTYVQQKRGNVGEIVTRRFSRQIASALSYLHERGIVHRDLKLENVMLDSKKRNIKLIDFGLTNSWTVDSPLKTLCGSPEYSAPELFIPGTVYGPEVDMWAFGVIMFAMAAGRLPFPCLSAIMKVPEKKNLFLKRVNDGLSDDQIQLIKGYPTEFIELIKGLMNPNSEERMTIKYVLSDPWITNRDHWVDVPYDTLDTNDLENIFKQLSFKLRHPLTKLDSEIRSAPFGETGGLFNIMVYTELHQRPKFTSDLKIVISPTETQSNLFFRAKSSKKRSSKQISEGPTKISLKGDEMRLNEVTRNIDSLYRQNEATPSSSTASESNFKPGIARKLTKLGKVSKHGTPHSNCSTPFDLLKNDHTLTVKSLQVDRSSRRRTVGKIVIPSKFKTSDSGNSVLGRPEKSWRKV